MLVTCNTSVFRGETPSTQCLFLSFHGIKAHPQKKKKLHKKTEKRKKRGEGSLISSSHNKQLALFSFCRCAQKSLEGKRENVKER